MPSAAYEVAKVESGLLEAKPSQNEMLELYGLAKVAEDVDIKSRPAPGMFDFAEKEKRKAWQKLLDEKVTPEQAEQRYIDLVASLKEKYGEKTELSAAEQKKLDEAKSKLAA